MTLKRILVGLALCALLVVIGGAFLPALHWDGAVALPVQITVIDADSKKPVSDASVEIVLPNMTMPPVKTDASGKSDFGLAFPAGGTSRFGYRTGNIHFGDHQLRISAEKYESQELFLMEETGKSRDIDDRAPISLTIELKPSVSASPTRSGR